MMKKSVCFIASPVIMTLLAFAAVTAVIHGLDNICAKLVSAEFALVIKQFESARLSFPFMVPAVLGLIPAYPIYRFTSLNLPLKILTVLLIILTFLAAVLLSLYLCKLNGIGISVIAKIIYDLFSGGALSELF